MAQLVFSDSRGQVVALKDDDDDVVFLWGGRPVAIVDDESASLYGFDGRHLGWFVEGWIRDHDGACVYYTDEASGGPVRPVRRTRPKRGARTARPRPRARQSPPPRHANQRVWSSLAVGGAFFDD
jgi:hypothetical protein